MSEHLSEFTNPDQLLNVVRMNASVDIHIEYIGDRKAPALLKFAEAERVTPKEYGDKLAVQAAESRYFSTYLQSVNNYEQFACAATALETWFGQTYKVPPRYAQMGRIDNVGLASSLFASAARLVHNDHDVKAVVQHLLPFMDTEDSGLHPSTQSFANMMHRVMAEFPLNAQRQGRAEYGIDPRAVGSIISEATNAGKVSPEFWYNSGLRSGSEITHFYLVEGIYEQIILRGNDIRPPKLATHNYIDDVMNFSSAVLGMVALDIERHPKNGWGLWRAVEATRSATEKQLSHTPFLELANGVTSKINAMPDGFHETLDDLPSGQRPLVDASDMRDLPEAMKRLLYVTRHIGTDAEIAEYHRYQDFVITGTLEGLIALLYSKKIDAALGATALQKLGGYQSNDASRLQNQGLPLHDWKYRRNKRRPGYGQIS